MLEHPKWKRKLTNFTLIDSHTFNRFDKPFVPPTLLTPELNKRLLEAINGLSALINLAIISERRFKMYPLPISSQLNNLTVLEEGDWDEQNNLMDSLDLYATANNGIQLHIIGWKRYRTHPETL